MICGVGEPASQVLDQSTLDRVQSWEAFADRRKGEYGRVLCIRSNLVNYPDNANAGNNDKDSRQVCA
jgi:hypothetical protein